MLINPFQDLLHTPCGKDMGVIVQHNRQPETRHYGNDHPPGRNCLNVSHQIGEDTYRYCQSSDGNVEGPLFAKVLARRTNRIDAVELFVEFLLVLFERLFLFFGHGVCGVVNTYG